MKTPEVDVRLSDPSVELHLNILAVHYGPKKDKKLQISHHTTFQNIDPLRLVQDKQKRVLLSKILFSYRAEFFTVLIELLSMWDDQLGLRSVARRLNKRIDDNTQPVRSAPDRAGQKSREFENVKIEKILSQNTIKPTQT